MKGRSVKRLFRLMHFSISGLRDTKTLFLGLFFIGLSLLVYLYVIPNQIFIPRKGSFSGLSPAAFPKFLTIVIGLFGIVLTVQAFLSSWKKGLAKPTGTILALRREIAVIVISVFYLYLIDLAGWLLTTVVTLFVLMRFYGSKRWLLICSLSILIPLILFLFFEEIALVRLPSGSLFR